MPRSDSAPPGRWPQSPPVVAAVSSQAAGARLAKAGDQRRPTRAQVKLRDARDDEAVMLEELLAAVVGRVGHQVAVVIAVVLRHSPRLRIEQVGEPQQVALEVEDRRVDQRA